MANTSYDISKAMEKIDELADTIGSADYLNLANALMDLYRRSQNDRRPTPVSASASASAEPVRHPLDILQERAEDYCDEGYYALFKRHYNPRAGVMFFRDYLTSQIPDDEDLVWRVCGVMRERHHQLTNVIDYKKAIIKTRMADTDALKELTRESIKDRVLKPYNKPPSTARPYAVRVQVIDITTDEITQYIRLGGKLYNCYVMGRKDVQIFTNDNEYDAPEIAFYAYKKIMRKAQIENGYITQRMEIKLENGNVGMKRTEDNQRIYHTPRGFVRIYYMEE